MPGKQIARDITYATSAQTRGGRAVIRVMENATGRLKLIRKVRGYDEAVQSGADFWQVVPERYGLSLQVVGGELENIPAEGPLIVVANHPYGILDGLMMGHILSARRGGAFKVLAHRIFRKSPDLERVILPVSFDDTKEAAQLNLQTRKEAIGWLGQGGAIGIFPGGTVSTGASPFSQPLDPQWRNFTARMIAKSEAAVVPIYFDGHNSRLFNIASHIHTTLRMGMLIREFHARLNAPVRVAIGAPIPREALMAHKGDSKAMMAFLRKSTYDLAPNAVDASRHGREFEQKYRPGKEAKGKRADGGGDL
ncbi:lysophospholipid acyltransferase family protein [Pseudoroseicyclus tamaricis]|uniref:Acyltransferase n=1 Tax=Pseudoroseicyclus tamaricis TaxID=2705421 RepID=A0A6B2JS85_9RHOB|nr:lysophospholipid acyltransferase family protein [Pseudoroseicyclus tamaricis]NDV01417.1 acyltransferase [Pseudoroseicyclus tamaricis]